MFKLFFSNVWKKIHDTRISRWRMNRFRARRTNRSVRRHNGRRFPRNYYYCQILYFLYTATTACKCVCVRACVYSRLGIILLCVFVFVTPRRRCSIMLQRTKADRRNDAAARAGVAEPRPGISPKYVRTTSPGQRRLSSRTHVYPQKLALNSVN